MSDQLQGTAYDKRCQRRIYKRSDQPKMCIKTYLKGYLDRYIDRCIGRYIDRYSIDPRPTHNLHVDRLSTNVSVELPLMSAEVSTVTMSGTYRSTTGRISVNYRQSVGRVLFNSRARVYRYYLLIYRLILSVILDTIHRYIDRYLILSTDVSIMHWPILVHLSTGRVSVECRPMYQPIYRPISTNTLGEG